METKHYVDKDGYYFGWQSSATPPTGSVEVQNPPEHGRQKWNGMDYDPLPPPSITELLSKTENIDVIAQKLEEVIDYIENGTPLSSESKAWMSDRKTIRQ